MKLSPPVRCLMLSALAATAILGSLPSHAEVEPYETVFDFWVGYTSPGPGSIDGELNYGVRGGYNISRRYTIGGELSWSEGRGSLADGMSRVEFDYDVINVDFIADINFAGKKPAPYAMTFGIGRRFVSASGTRKANTRRSRHCRKRHWVKVMAKSNRGSKERVWTAISEWLSHSTLPTVGNEQSKRCLAITCRPSV